MAIGITKILLLLVLVFVLFGMGRFSVLMRDLARGIGAFRREMRADDETQPRKALTDQSAGRET